MSIKACFLNTKSIFKHAVAVRQCVLSMTLVLLIVACRHGSNDFEKYTFTIDHINKYTPIRDQGRKQICWIYAMLATFEGDRLALGDSICLSPFYPARNYILEQVDGYYNQGGRKSLTFRATSLTALRLIGQYGAMPYDAYSHGEKVNFNALVENVGLTAQQSVLNKDGAEQCRKKVEDTVDKHLGYPTPHVHLYGAEYTPHEFARSVCPPDEYIGYTSFTHHHFYVAFPLEIPDNFDNSEYYNLPIDELTGMVIKAVKAGRSVCWEGDVSDDGFSFTDGVAVLPEKTDADKLQDLRQRMFENNETTDDHCMCIVGLAHDQFGERYFIMKNSWGTNNRYHGLMYMSLDYFKMKTISVVMTKAYHRNINHRHRPDREQYIYLR